MRAYLDNNATTPLAPEVRTRLLDVLDVGPLNPGSTHAAGRIAKQLLLDATNELAQALGLESRKVIFCGSASEAINLAIRGCLATTPQGHKHKVVTSSIEHPAVANTINACGEALSFQINRDGTLDSAGLKEALAEACLCAVMFANNETGVLLPVEEIADACREAGVPLLVDCCQAPGKAPFFDAIKRIDPDYLAISGHKVHAPVGIAALVMKERAKLATCTTGGGQQHGLRAGTEPVALASALARAMTLARQHDADLSGLVSKVEQLWRAIQEVAPNAERTVPDCGKSLCNTLHYRIPGLAAERQIIAFDVAGVECSASSACSSGSLQPSKAMMGMGFGMFESMQGIRMSVTRYTSDEEVSFACSVIQEVLGRLMRDQAA